MADKFYITTAIDDPDSPPHIGHAYEKILADDAIDGRAERVRKIGCPVR